MNEVTLVKLVSGDFAIGKKNSSGQLEDVVSVNIVPAEENMRVGLFPFMFPFTDKSIGLKLEAWAIACTIDCPEELRNNYYTFTTGIQVASAMPENVVPFKA